MATKSTAPAKRTTKAVKFNAADLPTVGGQYRHNGDYKPHLKSLSQFAKDNPVAGARQGADPLGMDQAGRRQRRVQVSRLCGGGQRGLARRLLVGW